MSPSRIPRPGGIGSPTITTSPLSQSSVTTRSTPALGTVVHLSKNPFAQLHNIKQQQQQHQQQQIQNESPTPSVGSTNNTLGVGIKGQSINGKRRIKPPSSPDLDDSKDFSTNNIRRSSPLDVKGRIPSNGKSSIIPGQRIIMRQPSTPTLINNQKSPIPLGRQRALSSTLSNKPIIINKNNYNSNLQVKENLIVIIPKIKDKEKEKKSYESNSLENREPTVPKHIKIRLKLLHQLGILLGIDSIEISEKIDIPGLLARVDQSYERDKERFENFNSFNNSNEIKNGIGIGNGNGNDQINLKGNLISGGGQSNKGVFGMFKRLGGSSNNRKGDENLGSDRLNVPQEGPAFGVPLCEAPLGSWCTSLIGGQKHELPLVVFTIVEEIYRRGMSQPGIFRLAGDGIRISHLTKVYNLPPLYGDSLPINQEPIHNLTGLVKRYVRDLPEPILDESLFPAFLAFCVDKKDDSSLTKDTEIQTENSISNDETKSNQQKSRSLINDIDQLPLETRIIAAQILLKLLPPLQFSLFIYLLAFLAQLPLFSDNRLNIESISIIFGPAMCAARGKGISGLGPTVSSNSTSVNNSNTIGGGIRRGIYNHNTFDPDMISDLVSKSQNVLSWLLKNWSSISEKVLEDDDSLISSLSNNITQPQDELKEKKNKKGKQIIDPRLLSPIDLRGSNDGMRARKPDSTKDFNINNESPNSSPIISSTASQLDNEDRNKSPIEPDIKTPHTTIQLGLGLRKSSSSHTLRMNSSGGTKYSISTSSGFGGMKSSPSSGGLFARALSSMSISSQAGNEDKLGKGPKRSASFTSLSSLVKKVGKDNKHVPPLPGRSMSDDRDNARSTVNPQITTVLGSLHDLLVSKDKQIERDAKELALLRHTLLEMDEKLQKSTLSSFLPGPIGINGCVCSIHPNSNISKQEIMPEIKITSTPSNSTIPTSISFKQNENEINELQIQLKTSLASLETCRLNLHKQNEKILIIESKNSRLESEKKLEISKLQVALALEQARCVGLIEERDLARDRLEKVKTTLFSVS
ncbi:uncharacterized protein I206_104550 [Kwoniella pini CBS 10737]|uniref:Rho-GAP domain-containing protein n=1 Tax=Kwoniella pini CBS 10737 TaxID=1296096 RepID=A0A1B9I750_9TREE|nr:uncharacterized protein I206_02084 [Kwoniella pini CBS 10737]OCF51370.1 hypothetical protein I206_02084 [Kwoniella pini CBS 10737]